MIFPLVERKLEANRDVLLEKPAENTIEVAWEKPEIIITDNRFA